MLHDRIGYGAVAIFLHWTIALLMFGQVGLGILMTRIDGPALQFWLIQWHKSFGLLILVLALVRLGWSAVAPQPTPVAGLSRVERVAAGLVQTALLVATIALPLTGWALVSASTLRIPTFAFNLVVIPNLPVTPSTSAESLWSRTHELLAYATILLAGGHAMAALRHHFLLHDTVLVRMLPFLNDSSNSGKGE